MCLPASVLDKDAYSQNDNPINPYSQFSEPGDDSVYKAGGKDEVDRRKKALTAALDRFQKTPEYITTKQAQGLKASLTKGLIEFDYAIFWAPEKKLLFDRSFDMSR